MEKPYAVIVKDNSTTNDSNNTEKQGVSYVVKALIKKKILFKQRPKPIIANIPKKLWNALFCFYLYFLLTVSKYTCTCTIFNKNSQFQYCYVDGLQEEAGLVTCTHVHVNSNNLSVMIKLYKCYKTDCHWVNTKFGKEHHTFSESPMSGSERLAVWIFHKNLSTSCIILSCSLSRASGSLASPMFPAYSTNKNGLFSLKFHFLHNGVCVI